MTIDLCFDNLSGSRLQKSSSDAIPKDTLQNSLFFLSFFCCSVREISMRDAEMCNARIKGSHTRRVFLASLSSPTHNFHARCRSLIIRFHPKSQRTHAKIRTVLQSKLKKTSARVSRLLVQLTTVFFSELTWKIAYRQTPCTPVHKPFTVEPRYNDVPRDCRVHR